MEQQNEQKIVKVTLEATERRAKGVEKIRT